MMDRIPGPLCLAVAALLAVPAAEAAAQQVVRLPAQDRVLRARPAPVFQVGREEGARWETFSGVRQVAFDPRGNLYVLDGGNHRVLVFSPEGRFVREFGQRGGGPGEFSLPIRMTVARDGSVVVADVGRRMFSLFRADGTFLRSVAHDPSWGATGLSLAAHPRAGVVAQAEALPVPGDKARSPGTRLLWYSLASGAQPVPLFQVPRAAATTRPAAARPGVSFQSAQRPAFSPGLHWGVLPDGGVAVAHTERYAVRVVGPTGAAVRVIERPISPRAVTAADRAREVARRREQSASRSGTVIVGGGGAVPPAAREALARQAESTQFASVIPAVQQIAVEPSGRLWIERAGREVGASGPVDLVSPQGAYLGTLAGQPMPDAFGPGGRAAYIERDELGVERVVVRRLPQAWQ